MGLCLLVIIAIGSLLFWLYQMNKDYYVLAFFAPRIRAKDGRPVETIAPVAKGRTIFGNSFDVYGVDEGKFPDKKLRLSWALTLLLFYSGILSGYAC